MLPLAATRLVDFSEVLQYMPSEANTPVMHAVNKTAVAIFFWIKVIFYGLGVAFRKSALPSASSTRSTTYSARIILLPKSFFALIRLSQEYHYKLLRPSWPIEYHCLGEERIVYGRQSSLAVNLGNHLERPTPKVNGSTANG